ncbi:MAG: chemotaxis protein CheA [Neomegalonema sp.]|nr:chemotaxis protein CheA [Neomegalonema sp.]
MDEMEEFLTVFFQECEERLGELQDNLALMVDGEWDAETLNAAFRAVHSVKGGAGAFGLDALVEFTHVFETVMDALRSDQLQLTPKICQVLLRASDMMSALIEDAQGNGAADKGLADKIRAELDALAKGEDPDAAAANVELAAPAAAEEPAEPKKDEAPAAAPAEAAAEEPEEDMGPPERELEILFEPGPDFVRSGHDPLKFIRALRQFGSVKAVADGDYPPLSDHEPYETQLTWRITLDTAVDLGEIDTFLIMYQLAADIEVSEPPSAEETPATAPTAEAKAPEAPAEADRKEPEAAPAEEAPAAEAASEPSEPTKAKEPSEPAPAEPRAEEPKRAGEGKAAAQQPRVSKALRVELSRIDRLVNMVGEIVITQAVLSQNFSDLDTGVNVEIGHAVEALSRQTRELQESVMAIRAQPVKSVFSRMPRVVRDLCASLNKDARIILSGEHTEVDTTVIEELSEPLTHMLRNSMDHGIETPEKREAAGKPRTGTINLSAEHRGERVRIVIEDDGAGINRERVLSKAVENGIVPPDATLTDEEIDMLIFHPGFSTAEKVTNVSGRGVGMDVVKKKVQALGGRVVVSSVPGKGTKFVITLPLTLAVLDGMTVGVGNERFILPLSSVVEAVKLDESNIDILPGEVRVMRYRGEWLPMICLELALNMETARSAADLVVVVETETDGRVAIIVDELLGQRQVVLKSLEANFRRVDGVSGATILGDGRVALILDIPSLQALSGGGALVQEMMI